MNNLLDTLQQHDMGLLVTIDEIDPRQEELIFFGVHQHYVQENRTRPSRVRDKRQPLERRHLAGRHVRGGRGIACLGAGNALRGGLGWNVHYLGSRFPA